MKPLENNLVAFIVEKWYNMEDIMMNDEYEVIKEFECHGKPMVIVRIGNAAHVMSQEEWRKVYGRNHQNKCVTKVDWNRFRTRKEYKQRKIS